MLITVIVLTLIVFGSRYLFLSPKVPIKLHPHLEGILSYASPAVLTAIWIPIVFFPQNELNLSLQNPYLLGAVLASVIAYYTKSILKTTILSMIFFFILKFYFFA